MINRKIEAMLFDFDGTLADTSEDMVNCLNILLKNHGKNDVGLSEAKNFISKGAGGLIDFSCPNRKQHLLKVEILKLKPIALETYVFYKFCMHL